MGRRPEKEYRTHKRREVINWHISQEEKEQIKARFDSEKGCLNDYMKKSVLAQDIVVVGTSHNRNKLVERLKGLDSLLKKLDCNSEKLSADDQGEISIIREIRRVWDVDQNE